MSAPSKPRGTASGQPEAGMQKLKAAWARLPEATRDYWRTQFGSRRTQADIRAEMGLKLGVKLNSDSRLSYFRDWVNDQDLRDRQAERMEENARRIKQEHPDWTLDLVRDEVLRQSYFETLATGDFKTGLKAISAHNQVEALKFDQEKFKEGFRSKLEAGLTELAQHIKGNPAAKAAYDAFRATIKETTK